MIIGLLVGLLNMVNVTVLNMPTFVSTLANMFILNGLTNMFNQGRSLTTNIVPGFSMLGQGSILYIPIPFIIVLCLCFILNFFFKRTRSGLRMYATGENAVAAQLRGINTKKYLAMAYFVSGLLLGLTGVIQTSYAYGAQATASSMDYLVQALSAAYLGSTFSRTGELSVIGTVLSSIFVASLSNLLILNGISNLLMFGIQGLTLILSILLRTVSKKEIGQATIF